MSHSHDSLPAVLQTNEVAHQSLPVSSEALSPRGEKLTQLGASAVEVLRLMAAREPKSVKVQKGYKEGETFVGSAAGRDFDVDTGKKFGGALNTEAARKLTIVEARSALAPDGSTYFDRVSLRVAGTVQYGDHVMGDRSNSYDLTVSAPHGQEPTVQRAWLSVGGMGAPLATDGYRTDALLEEAQFCLDQVHDQLAVPAIETN